MKPTRLPPPKTRTLQQEPTPEQPQKVNEEKLLADLEVARAGLQKLVLEFKELLKSTKLSSNRSVEDNKVRQKIIFDINDAAGKLDYLNAGEGLMTLAVTSLHSMFMLKDEINDLRFQNAVLNKKLVRLQGSVESVK